VSENVGRQKCTLGEDEAAAAAVIKSVIKKVVDDEQKEYIAALATKATELELKYEAANKPREDEEGVTRSPDLPRVRVDFTRVNPFALAKLPKPQSLPRLGCSEDADLYNKCIIHKSDEACDKSPAVCKSKFSDSGTYYAKQSLKHKGYITVTNWCFGTRAGFVTDLGVIPPPSEPVHGYVYSYGTGENTSYVLHADAA